MKSEVGKVQIEVGMFNINYLLKDLIWEKKRKRSDWGGGDGEKGGLGEDVFKRLETRVFLYDIAMESTN